MAAIDLITVAEFKTRAPKAGSAKDSKLAALVSVGSRLIEDAVGRRLVYRAPPEVLTYDNVISTSFTNGTPAGSQPNSAGRTLVVVFPTTATAGVVTITGTVAGVVGVTEAFDVVDGLLQHGLKFFTAVSAITITGAAGGGTLKIGTSLGYIDYHTPRCDPSELLSYEWPRQQTLELNEDTSRAFGTSSRLTLGTDYAVMKRPEGDYLVRLSSSLPIAFLGGWRSIKDVYSAGYRIAQIPGPIKDECVRLVTALFDESEKGRVEMASGSGPFGNWQRFGQAGLSGQARRNLAAYSRYRFGADTAEHDFDLEAA